MVERCSRRGCRYGEAAERSRAAVQVYVVGIVLIYRSSPPEHVSNMCALTPERLRLRGAAVARECVVLNFILLLRISLSLCFSRVVPFPLALQCAAHARISSAQRKCFVLGTRAPSLTRAISGNCSYYTETAPELWPCLNSPCPSSDLSERTFRFRREGHECYCPIPRSPGFSACG